MKNSLSVSYSNAGGTTESMTRSPLSLLSNDFEILHTKIRKDREGGRYDSERSLRENEKRSLAMKRKNESDRRSSRI